MGNRSFYFDNAKFLLILLVIFGHVLPLNFYYPMERGTYNFIFSFHMPLFVFISGYFTKIDDKDKFINGIKRIAETLLCFHVIHLLLSLLLGKSLTLRNLIIPGYTLWYLLCLIYWRLAFFIAKPSVYSHRTLSVSLALLLLAGFIPLGADLAFQRAFFFFPFFCLGYYAREKDWLQVVSKLSYKSCFVALVAFLLVLIASAVISKPYFVYDQNLLYGEKYYMAFSYPIWFSVLMRFVYLIIAILVSVCFLRIVPKTERFYTKYGKETLFFYVYHSVLIILLRHIVGTYGLPDSYLYCIVYFIAIVILLFIMKRIAFWRFLINPLSNLRRKVYHA